MVQPTYTAVRKALAATLAAQVTNPDGSALRTVANRIQVNPPAAVIMPVTGTIASYSQTFDGSLRFMLRAIVLVSEGDSASGMDNIDPYIATTGSQSIWAAVRRDTTLSGTVEDAFVSEVTAYGLMNWMAVDYLAAHFIVQIMA